MHADASADLITAAAERPARSRVLLKLALLKTSDAATIQAMFDRY